MSDQSTILEWASRFARAGYFVFPLYESSNGPQKPYGWARNATTTTTDQNKIIPATNDLNVIAEWPMKVASAYKSKVCGYGILGAGVVIFDLDNKNGKNGSEAFKQIRLKYSIPKPEMVVKSKSGGYHLYYGKNPKLSGVQIKTLAGIALYGVKYDGVDVRGDSGMVLGPTSEGDEASWKPGEYRLILGGPEKTLTVCPDAIVMAIVKTGVSDAENLASIVPEKVETDVVSILKRGEIPTSLPLGERNNGFYLFLNALKNKGFSKETARLYARQLEAVTESPETLAESVNVEEMLSRIWTVNSNNPFDVARDLIRCGLYRLTNHTRKIQYVILEPNPYIESKSPHDLASMKQLMGRFTRSVIDAKGKAKLVNPAELLDGLIEPVNEVSNLGFKPGDAPIFSLSSMQGGKRYLNTWQDPLRNIQGHAIDPTYYAKFCDLVGRIFGPEGSEEYDLGLDFPAWLLQHPGRKPVIAPYVTSLKRGVGKSLYFTVLQSIFGFSLTGDLQARPYKVDSITGRFFSPSGSCALLFDEVQFPVHRDMRKEATTFWRHLKNLVTADNVEVEIKGGDTVQMPNMAGIILAGNSGNNFPIEEFDRRIWVIDNSPAELEVGTFDHFFALTKGMLEPEHRRSICASILKGLQDRKIRLQLDRIRAPMNAAKKDMFLNSLSDIEEWWITHFDDPENLLAATPILTKSAIIYLIETSERLMKTAWREDPESTFRDLRRKGLIRSVKAQNAPITRQLTSLAEVRADGSVKENPVRDVLYTSRQHGEFDKESNETLHQAYNRNLNTIKKYKDTRKQALDTKSLIM